MSTDPARLRGPEEDRSVGELVIDVSERVSLLVREEIELAKAEVTEKVTQLVRGSVVGIVAGVFAWLGLAMLMHAFAWLLNELFFEDEIWLGFLVEAVIWFLIAAAAGFFAYRSMKAGRRRRRRWRSPRRRRSARPSRRAPMSDNPELVPRQPAGVDRPSARRRAPATPSRSAPTSSASARSSAVRSRPARPGHGLTDWRRVREHRRELVIGAAVVGRRRRPDGPADAASPRALRSTRRRQQARADVGADHRADLDEDRVRIEDLPHSSTRWRPSPVVDVLDDPGARPGGGARGRTRPSARTRGAGLHALDRSDLLLEGQDRLDRHQPPARSRSGRPYAGTRACRSRTTSSVPARARLTVARTSVLGRARLAGGGDRQGALYSPQAERLSKTMMRSPLALVDQLLAGLPSRVAGPEIRRGESRRSRGLGQEGLVDLTEVADRRLRRGRARLASRSRS